MRLAGGSLASFTYTVSVLRCALICCLCLMYLCFKAASVCHPHLDMRLAGGSLASFTYTVSVLRCALICCLCLMYLCFKAASVCHPNLDMRLAGGSLASFTSPACLCLMSLCLSCKRLSPSPGHEAGGRQPRLLHLYCLCFTLCPFLLSVFNVLV
jgi:hypothetical protein